VIQSRTEETDPRETPYKSLLSVIFIASVII